MKNHHISSLRVDFIMKKSYVVASVAVIVAIASVALFIGRTSSFNKKIDYLSDRYPAYTANRPFKQVLSEVSQMGWLVYEANSWTTFKSLLIDFSNSWPNDDIEVFYEPSTHTIWFSAVAHDDYGSWIEFWWIRF